VAIHRNRHFRDFAALPLSSAVRLALPPMPFLFRRLCLRARRSLENLSSALRKASLAALASGRAAVIVTRKMRVPLTTS